MPKLELWIPVCVVGGGVGGVTVVEDDPPPQPIRELKSAIEIIAASAVVPRTTAVERISTF
jgi:hypothetical protein